MNLNQSFTWSCDSNLGRKVPRHLYTSLFPPVFLPVVPTLSSFLQDKLLFLLRVQVLLRKCWQLAFETHRISRRPCYDPWPAASFLLRAASHWMALPLLPSSSRNLEQNRSPTDQNGLPSIISFMSWAARVAFSRIGTSATRLWQNQPYVPTTPPRW